MCVCWHYDVIFDYWSYLGDAQMNQVFPNMTVSFSICICRWTVLFKWNQQTATIEEVSYTTRAFPPNDFIDFFFTSISDNFLPCYLTPIVFTQDAICSPVFIDPVLINWKSFSVGLMNIDINSHLELSCTQQKHGATTVDINQFRFTSQRLF